MTKRPDPCSAEWSSTDDQFENNPAYTTDDSSLSPVWESSEALRKLIFQKADYDAEDRSNLRDAIARQIQSIVLYEKVDRKTSSKTMSLYVLMFPGEARDNTGIKDLNDKVLGSTLNTKYIRRRQEEIKNLYEERDDVFAVISQDYKTAYIYTADGSRKQFIERLAILDDRLRKILLWEILPEAEKKEKDQDKLAAIRKLKATLEADEKYKFDIFFGLTTVLLSGHKPVEILFMLLTEALKGAGLARFITKGQTLKRQKAKAFAKGVLPDPPALDQRGKEFKWDTYFVASKRAGEIKNLMTAKPARSKPADYNQVFIDTVWTRAFLEYRRLWYGNPDMVRDVRKKKLQPPPSDQKRQDVYEDQKELLEFWLIILNMLDFVKDFLIEELHREVVRYYEEGQDIRWDLENAPKVDRTRLERILTHDVQDKRIAILGTASEFQFYSYASDYPDRIFFSMDMRDLGVDLMLWYEKSNEQIVGNKYKTVKLMEETCRSSDPINAQKRFTYERVVEVFKKYHKILQMPGATGKASVDARVAFGYGRMDIEPMPGFAASVQILRGGDEVFVAAHRYFAGYVPNIVADLAKPFKKELLNMRTAIAYSTAERVEDPKLSAADRKTKQKEKNQASHDQALHLADKAPEILKDLERTQRRIERLIEKLGANDKKRHLAGPYMKELEKLGLVRLFARVKHGDAKLLTPAELRRLLKQLRTGKFSEVKPKIELIDFSGAIVNRKKLTADAEALEARIRKDVGSDNSYQDSFPAGLVPEIIIKIHESRLFGA